MLLSNTVGGVVIELDKSSITFLRFAYPELRTRVLELLEETEKATGLKTRITRVFSSYEQQQKLYAQGRTAAGEIVTNAKPGRSFHNFGLAADICFRGPDPYLIKNPIGEKIWSSFGERARNLGLVWGGGFKIFDKPHVQFSATLSIEDCIRFSMDGGIDNLWMEIDRRLGKSLRAGWDLVPGVNYVG